jgi:hypothetical protein
MFPGFDKIIKLPWTMSFVIRKNKQIDSFRELPKEKRPPTSMIWWGTPEELDRWFDRVFDRKKEDGSEVFLIDESEIE